MRTTTTPDNRAIMAWSCLNVNKMMGKHTLFIFKSPCSCAHLVMHQGVLLHGFDDLVVNEGEQEDGDDP